MQAVHWYFAGMALCAGCAWGMKRSGFRKNVYEAALVLAGGFLLAAALWQMDESGRMQERVTRNLPGQGQEEKDYLVDAEGVLEQYPVKVPVEEKQLTKKQRKECFRKAKQELDQAILGENVSLDNVQSSLHLPDTLQEGAVSAEYSFSDYEVFDAEGALSGSLTEPVLVEVAAELTCQGETCLYSFFVRAVPREKSEQEQFAGQLGQLLEMENQKKDKGYLELPTELEGIKVIWREQTENRSWIGLLLGAAGAAGVILAEKERKKREELERQQQMMLDYPEIVSKLSLLLGAGMNITCAWEKIASSYQKRKKLQEVQERWAYEEMLAALHEIQEGVGELQAFGNFGERCRLAPYRKLSSLIVQNIRKGANGMQRLLNEEEREAFEERKARARKAGEEAGTKLLLPMGMMLAVVLAILVVPAGLTLNL